MPDMGEIVVTGTRVDNHNVAYYLDTSGLYHTLKYDVQTHDWVDTGSGPSRPGSDDPANKSDTVAVHVTDPAHQTEALKAAENILNALNKLRSDLANDATTVVNFAGHTMNGAEVLTLLNSTTFFVTDNQQTNGGVTYANYSPTGGSVEMNFEAFDGDGVTDYADPAYSNGEGMAGILLHELGHLTSYGHSFSDSNWIYFNQEMDFNHDHSQVYDRTSAYWLNNEAYANSFATDLASAFGVDINEWGPLEGTTWVPASTLYSQHTGGGGGDNSILAGEDDQSSAFLNQEQNPPQNVDWLV